MNDAALPRVVVRLPTFPITDAENRRFRSIEMTVYRRNATTALVARQANTCKRKD